MYSKFGKERKLYVDEKFRVKYGTIDALKLNAIYLNIESWVKPKEIINFETDIRLLRKKVLLKIKESLNNELFNENIIADLDLRCSGVRLNKKSFMSFEITIYPKKVIKFNSDILKKEILNITTIATQILESSNFNFTSKK